MEASCHIYQADQQGCCTRDKQNISRVCGEVGGEVLWQRTEGVTRDGLGGAQGKRRMSELIPSELILIK
jgi:hypothetical protein